MKILKSDFNFRNTLIFTILSLFFLLSIHALSIGQFIFSKPFALLAFKENYLIILICFVTFYSIYAFKKFSHYVLMLFLIIVVFKSFIFLSSSFNKLVLGLNFIYIVFAFYFFTSWELFKVAAVHNPKFEANDLEKNSRFNLAGVLMTNSESSYSVLVTNIDEEGCFVVFNDAHIPNVNLNMAFDLKVELDKTTFYSKAICVSQYDNGIGLKYLGIDNNLRSLSGLYQVCLDRGLV